MEFEKYYLIANKLCNQGQTHSQIITKLFEHGASLVQTSVIIKQVLGISLEEANSLVSNSNEWRPAVDSSNDLLDKFIND